MSELGRRGFVTRAARRICRGAVILLVLAAVAWPLGVAAQAPAGGRVKVLFIGDNGHHQPTARAKIVQPILAHHGIDVFYTDDASDLNRAELGQYHALILYNNHAEVTRPQLSALLSFVEQGGGLVVVHCASASFQNSEEFIRLVGAAFKSHGTGTFSTVTVAPDHPVMQGLPEFESWDETYIHTKHNPDRTVLAVRVEGGHEEPWTWVRGYGEGRVFYTAWGHDERTWGNEGFQRLLDRGIKWSAGDWALAQELDEPVPALADLPVPLPVYRQDTVWNVLADEHVTREAVPLAPEQSIELMTLRPGFRAEHFASEPLIGRIIDFTWDERGRMWAVETNDYPNTVLPDSVPGGDRILILEDTNGDGRADSRTVFAEGMNLATSLTLANGGVVVAQAPHMLFFRDTTGDDRADERKILITGWPRNDTHGTPSNLRYGFDNQVWGSVGYNGFRGTVGGVTYEPGEFGAGYYRFAADGTSLDYVARTSNNTWGFGFSEDGYMFGSTANSQASAFVHIPGRYYRNIGVPNPILPRIEDRTDIFPVRDVYQVDQFGRYTAGAAHELYTARAFPEEYWNRMAFVAEPTGHLVGMFELSQTGSAFTAKNRWNLMASRDAWAAPVQAKVGPDGAVWVADFYSLVAQHNPTPENLTGDCCVTGPGNAYETPNRDPDHARIYRIVHDAAAPAEQVRLDGATPQQLVATLRNDNMFWRFTAQRLLVERGQTDVVPALVELVNDQTVDALGLNAGALHALWTLHGLGAIENDVAVRDVARRALHHPAASLRRAALQVLPRDPQLLEDIFAAGLLPDRSSPHEVDYTVGAGTLQDADAQVRLTALLAMSELPPSPRAASAIADLILVPQNARDRWLPDAAAIAGVQQGPDFAVALLTRTGEIGQDGARGRPAGQDSAYLAGLRNTIQLMVRHYAAKEDASAVVALLVAVPQANPTVASGVFTAIAGMGGNQGAQRGGRGRGFAGSWPEDSAPQLTPEQRAALVEAARAAAPELAEGFARVAERWGMADLFSEG